MTSNTVPVYRHGRKFYVSTEEYERIRSEERQQRRSAAQKSQHIPVTKLPQTHIRAPSASLYTPIQRSQSNPHDYKYGVLRTSHLPTHSLINSNNRQQSNRLSRSTLKYYNDQNDSPPITSGILKKQTPPNSRSNSSNKNVDYQRTPLSSDSESDIKRSFSAEIAHLLASPEQSKSKPQSQSPSRRPVPTTISDYGISPTTTFSMTPNDQTHTQTNPSKLTKYFTRMKKSSLNPSSSSNSATGSVFESGIQGSDSLYTVLGSSNKRIGTTSSSILTRSKSDNNSKNEYYRPDTASGSFSDDTSSSLLGLIQRRNTDTNRSRSIKNSTEIDDDQNQQRDLWTRSTNRSQSSDGLVEKKRVRFADMEGLTLETTPDRNYLKSPVNNRLLTRRQHVKISNDSRGQPRPFYNALFQAATKVSGSKLATDV